MITRGLAGQWPPPSGSLPVPPRPPFTPPTRQTPSSAAQNPGPLAQGSLPTPGSLWGTSLPPATPLSAEPSCESAELPLLPKLAVHGAPAPPPGLVQPRSGHPPASSQQVPQRMGGLPRPVSMLTQMHCMPPGSLSPGHCTHWPASVRGHSVLAQPHTEGLLPPWLCKATRMGSASSLTEGFPANQGQGWSTWSQKFLLQDPPCEYMCVREKEWACGNTQNGR